MFLFLSNCCIFKELANSITLLLIWHVILKVYKNVRLSWRVQFIFGNPKEKAFELDWMASSQSPRVWGCIRGCGGLRLSLGMVSITWVFYQELDFFPPALARSSQEVLVTDNFSRDFTNFSWYYFLCCRRHGFRQCCQLFPYVRNILCHS